MRPWIVVSAFALGLLAGCMAAGPATQAQGPGSADRSPLGSPFGDNRVQGLHRSWPLLLDPTDVSIGTSVVFNRVPNSNEIHDLDLVRGVRQVVMALPSWPSDVARLESLTQMPPQVTGIVILPGYPPNRAAAEAWNLIPARLRIVVLVDGPPVTAGVLSDLNQMRGLERVIAEMEDPSQSGFERLQRPLSFRKIIE